jgi:hypothetical protein
MLPPFLTACCSMSSARGRMDVKRSMRLACRLRRRSAKVPHKPTMTCGHKERTENVPDLAQNQRCMRKLLSVFLLALSACAINRIDFDAYLNGWVGKPLTSLHGDWSASKTGNKTLLYTTDLVATYRYTNAGSPCSWDIDADRNTGIVLAWRYPNSHEADLCHNLARAFV